VRLLFSIRSEVNNPKNVAEPNAPDLQHFIAELQNRATTVLSPRAAAPGPHQRIQRRARQPEALVESSSARSIHVRPRHVQLPAHLRYVVLNS